MIRCQGRAVKYRRRGQAVIKWLPSNPGEPLKYGFLLPALGLATYLIDFTERWSSAGAATVLVWRCR